MDFMDYINENGLAIGLWIGLIGVIITAGSLWYAVRSGRDLKQESKKLRQHTKVIIDGLEAAGIIKVVRDRNGDPKGINVTLKPDSVIIKTSCGTPTVHTTSGGEIEEEE